MIFLIKVSVWLNFLQFCPNKRYPYGLYFRLESNKGKYIIVLIYIKKKVEKLNQR